MSGAGAVPNRGCGVVKSVLVGGGLCWKGGGGDGCKWEGARRGEGGDAYWRIIAGEDGGGH